MKGLPKTKRCNSVAVTVSVRFRFGFGVYVKQPLNLHIQSHVGCLSPSNHEIIDGLSSESLVRYFYKRDTTDYRLLWGKNQSDYKDHEFKAVTWNNLHCKGISAI